MKNKSETLRAKAKKLADAQARDEFLRPVATLQRLGFLYADGTQKSKLAPPKLIFKEALAAAKIEPRIAEVLPAVYIRRPKTFLFPESAPADLKAIALAWKKKMPLPDFFDVPGDKYKFWIEHFRRKGSAERKTLKTFRFSDEDIALLKRVQARLGTKGAAETIRISLSKMEK